MASKTSIANSAKLRANIKQLKSYITPKTTGTQE